MRKLMVTSALVLACAASPVMAAEGGEGRITLRGGYDTTDIDVSAGGADASVSTGDGVGFGVAAGYDFDIGEKVFAGVEAGFDLSTAKKTFDGDRYKAGREITAIARVGFKPSDQVKIYALGGYTNLSVKVDSESDSGGGITYGGGAAYKINDVVGLNLEYRRSTVDVVGVLDEDGDVSYNKSRISLGISYLF
jgi:opacity protein-like surface antigen